MKNVIMIVLLISFIVAAPAISSVHTRLQLVSNEGGILVVDVQAMSDAGTPLINTYRGAFKISETLEKRVVAVGFQNFIFNTDNYEVLVGYSSDYRKVTWVYSILPAGQHSAIPQDWTTVVRVVIVYNISNENATITWAGSPYYLVEDDNGMDITGDYMPIPPDLQDFPLPVELTTFTATRESEGANLEWRTESELNNLGFHVYRSEQVEEGYVRITDELIKGQGTTTAAHDYNYFDASANPETDYWYTLETISTDGLSTFYGPIEAASLSAIKDEISTTPREFALFQNYPNPFNPNTEIRYQLGESATASLTVFDVRGKLVKRLFSGERDAGTYTAVWDGLDAAGARVNSGIYIYELKTGDQVFYRKMTLIK